MAGAVTNDGQGWKFSKPPEWFEDAYGDDIEDTYIGVQHTPKVGGELWFVSTTGDNSDDGENPHTAFLTIGHACTTGAAGDVIIIKAGTYTEVGIEVYKDSQELWFEIGSILDPATGTALMVSGDHVKIQGEHKITPDPGNAVGMLVSGAECVISDGRILLPTNGMQITGSGCIINDYAIGFPSAGSYAYLIQADQIRLNECATVGNTTSTGYRINSGADTGVLRNCTSAGHETASIHIETGSADWTIFNYSSGGGDGRWVDIDKVNVFTNFSFDDVVFKETDFSDAVETTTWNLFKITGGVRLHDIIGHVETQLEGIACTFQLILYSVTAGGDPAITTASADANAAVAGALFVKNAPSDEPLDFGDPDGTPVVVENANWKDPNVSIDLVAENGVATYVQLVLSADLDLGIVHWHTHWDPLTDDGFVEPYVAP